MKTSNTQVGRLLLVAWAATLVVSGPAHASPPDVHGSQEHAGPTVVLGPSTGLDGSQLRASIVARAGGDRDVTVTVRRLGAQQLVIDLGGRSKVIHVAGYDDDDASRVVVMVVVSMLTARVAASAVPVVGSSAHDSERPPGSQRVVGGDSAQPSRWHATLRSLRTLEDDGYSVQTVDAGVTRRLTEQLWFTGSVGLGHLDDYLSTNSLLVPVRLGIEGRAGNAALEIGGQRIWYRESSCQRPQWGSHSSIYGAAKIYVPVKPGVRLVGEIGGYLVGSRAPTTCNSLPNYTDYGGWFGGGAQWEL